LDLRLQNNPFLRLTYDEFRQLIQSSKLGLSDDLVTLIMQHADEDADGRIEYKEFIPLGVEMMQVGKRSKRRKRGKGGKRGGGWGHYVSSVVGVL
jgi:hypothetical protein